VPADDVQAPIAPRVGVRLFARVEDRPPRQGVDAGDLRKEVRPLGELVMALLLERPARLDAYLTSAGIENAGHQEREHPVQQLLEGDPAGAKIPLVAAVA